MLSVCGYIMRLYRERDEAEVMECAKLALGGKKGIRRWLEERK